MERATGALGIELRKVIMDRPEELDAAFAEVRRAQVGALVVQAVLATPQLAALALKHRMPTISSSPPFVEAGGLMGYGASLADLYRQAAVYVDKILKGAKPADLPIEQPTRFELLVNLKTAKALGLTIPQSVLLRADRVIQ